MNKFKFMFLFIGYIVISFLFSFNVVRAEEVIISEAPTSSELVYGQPLFDSILIGGSVNVSGKFEWVDELEVLDYGVYQREVAFVPVNKDYDEKIIKINVTINKRRVYLKFEDDLYKRYDGSNEIRLPNYIVNGIIDRGVYVSGKLRGVLDSALVSENVKVSLSGIELKGDKKDNYYLDLGGFNATIYPQYIEKFGEVKNRIDFGKGIYVPVNSLIYVDKIDGGLKIKGYAIKDVYDVCVKSNGVRIEIDGKVSVKVKIDESSLKYKGISLYNYYKGEYKEISYTYSDGYLMYSSDGLGLVVIAQKKMNFWWIYILMFVLILIVMCIMIKKVVSKRKKIKRYKSLKRGKDDGNY